MTYEQIKDLLKNFASKKSRIKTVRLYIDKERALMDGIRGISYDGVRVASSAQNGTESRYVKSLDRLNDLEARYTALMEDMCQEEQMLLDMMSGLAPTEYEVILNRFFMGYKPPKTAKLMGYSLDGLYDIQERAIKKMSQHKSSQ